MHRLCTGGASLRQPNLHTLSPTATQFSAAAPQLLSVLLLSDLVPPRGSPTGEDLIYGRGRRKGSSLRCVLRATVRVRPCGATQPQGLAPCVLASPRRVRTGRLNRHGPHRSHGPYLEWATKAAPAAAAAAAAAPAATALRPRRRTSHTPHSPACDQKQLVPSLHSLCPVCTVCAQHAPASVPALIPTLDPMEDEQLKNSSNA